MIIDLMLPEVNEPKSIISDYWIRYLLAGSPSHNHQINALANTYMRLAEAAITEYRLGSEALREVWSNNNSISLREMHRSISHFESCVLDMHRAISAFRRLRNHRDRDPISIYLADVKPTFISKSISDQIKDMRDAILHLDEKVINGEVAQGQPIALKADGEITPLTTTAGQTLKTIDRLVIGPHVLKFNDIAVWLIEMSDVASKIAKFDPRQTVSQP